MSDIDKYIKEEWQGGGHKRKIPEFSLVLDFIKDPTFV